MLRVEAELAVLVGLCAAWGLGDGWEGRRWLGRGGPPQHPQVDRLARLAEQLRSLLLTAAVQPLPVHLASTAAQSNTHSYSTPMPCVLFLYFDFRL